MLRLRGSLIATALLCVSLSARAWGGLETSAQYTFVLRQTVDTVPDPLMGAGSGEVRGLVSRCRVDAGMWKISVEEPGATATVFVETHDGKIVQLFRSESSKDAVLAHAKRLAAALQSPSLLQETEWKQGELNGKLYIELKRNRDVQDCLAERTTLKMVPEGSRDHFDTQSALKSLEKKRADQLRGLSLRDLLLSNAPKDAVLALQLLQSRKSPLHEKQALRLFESSVKRGDVEATLRIGGVLAQYGFPEGQRAVAKAAGRTTLPPETAERLARLLFLPKKGDRAAVEMLLRVGDDKSRTLGIRDAAVLAGASLASVTGDAVFEARIKTYLEKKLSASGEALTPSYKSALGNLQHP